MSTVPFDILPTTTSTRSKAETKAERRRTPRVAFEQLLTLVVSAGIGITASLVAYTICMAVS